MGTGSHLAIVASITAVLHKFPCNLYPNQVTRNNGIFIEIQLCRRVLIVLYVVWLLNLRETTVFRHEIGYFN